MWFDYAFKNLVRKKSFSLFFLVNFSISLVAIFSLFLFQDSIESYIGKNAKQILTAEMSVSARRDLSDQEKKLLKTRLSSDIERTSYQIQAYSMSYVGEKSRLVLIKGIENNFPLFGELLLRQNQEAYKGLNSNSGNMASIFESKDIWVYPELLIQLNLKIGDEIKLGSETFKISDVVEKDVGIGGFGSALAPTVYMSLDNLKSTGLVGFGSTAWYTRYFDLKDDVAVEQLQKKWNDELSDPAIQVNVYTNANQQIGRLQSYLGDYLGLVALVSLLLSIVGAYYLFRSHLLEQAKSIALLEINGASSTWLIKVYISQILLLSLVAGAFSLLLSFMFSQSWVKILSLGGSYEGLSSSIFPAIVILLLLIIFIISCMLPFVLKFIAMDKASALMDSKSWEWNFDKKDVLMFLFPLSIFIGLAVYISKSYVVGGLFVAVMLVALLLTFLSYRIIIFIASRMSWKSFSARYVFRHLARDAFGSISILFALGISFLLMSLVPQLQKSLNQELLFPKTDLLPDLFFFDVQDDQVSPLEKIVKDNNLSLKYISPMIRTRLLAVNGEDFEKPRDSTKALTREEEREMRFRNRGFNLSYRSELSSSEKIVEGQMWKTDFDSSSAKLAEISIEQRFAKRLDLKMNDILKFDIQGVEIEGEITSFRSVKWTSFQPNFFLLFQPGLLEEAPKTFLAAIGGLNSETKQGLQSQVVDSLPNISIVDVEFLVKRILEIFEKMAFAIEILAIFSFIAGLFMVFVIANTRSKERKKDFLYLRLFGASEAVLHWVFQLEFLVVVLVSFLFSLVLSYSLSFFLVSYVFESTLQFDWAWPLFLLLSSLFICFLLVYSLVKSMLTKEEYTELLSS